MIQTEIRFVAGRETESADYELSAGMGLTHRFAVIQESYRPDKVDTYFDEALWRSVVAFAEQYVPGAAVTVTEDNLSARAWVSAWGRLRAIAARWLPVTPPPRPPAVSEIPIGDFLAATRDWADDEPPSAIFVRRGGTLELYIETEFWTQAGGPWPYHDSYTYAVFSREDISARIMRFLREANTKGLWDIAEKPLAPGASPPVRKN